ncbi:MAG: DUF1993 domain-containing protein [Hyphomicrobiaceae bacterium]
MTKLTMHAAAVPPMIRMLQALAGVLDKGAAFAAARKIDPAVLVGARLFADMHPLSRQVQTACDFAKGAGGRLAGVELPKYEDNEQTFGELKARIEKTVAFLAGLDPARFEGSDERRVSIRIGGRDLDLAGSDYLFGLALPNFYFHLTTAYDILRHNGVEIGKKDYMGQA